MTAEGTGDLVLRPSRKKWFAILAVSLAFVTVAGTIEPSSAIRWLTTIFFGLGAIVSLAMLATRRVFLRLTPEGFEQHSFFGTSGNAWNDIDRFVRYRPGGFAKQVGIVYAAGYDKHTRARRGVRAIAGVEGGLPDTYGMSADDLARLLNEWATRHRTP